MNAEICQRQWKFNTPPQRGGASGRSGGAGRSGVEGFYGGKVMYRRMKFAGTGDEVGIIFVVRKRSTYPPPSPDDYGA